MPTVAELGQKVKTKYPGTYDDIDDAEVGRRVKGKYPGAYDDFEDIADQPGTVRKVLGSTFGAVGRGVGNVIEGAGGAVKAITHGATGSDWTPGIGEWAGDALTKAGAYLARQPAWVQEAAASPNKWWDPVFLSNLAFEGAGSTLASFVPGGAAARAVGAAGRIPVPVLRKAAQFAAGTAAGAFFESLSDAGHSYNEAIEKHGASPAAAAAVFRETVKNEAAITAIASAPEHLMPKAGSAMAKIVWAAANSVMEGVEEVGQGAAQRHSMNKVLDQNAPLLEGAAEEFAGGVLGGAAVSAGRVGTNAFERWRERRRGELDTMPPAAGPASTEATAPSSRSKTQEARAAKEQAKAATLDNVRALVEAVGGPVPISRVTQDLEIGAHDALQALRALERNGLLEKGPNGWQAIARTPATSEVASVGELDQAPAEVVQPVAEAIQPVAEPLDQAEEIPAEVVQPAAPVPSPRSAPALPRELAGAKPRYNFGSKAFLVEFDNDLDRAVYIAQQEKKSSRDSEYRDFARQAGLSDEQIDARGAEIKAEIKRMATAAKGGDAKNPEVLRYSAKADAAKPETNEPVSETIQDNVETNPSFGDTKSSPDETPAEDQPELGASKKLAEIRSKINARRQASDTAQTRSLPAAAPAVAPAEEPNAAEPAPETAREVPPAKKKSFEATARETAARAVKIDAFVAHLQKHGFDADMVDAISDRQWAAVAQSAGQRPPSETTIAAIRQRMRAPAKVETAPAAAPEAPKAPADSSQSPPVPTSAPEAAGDVTVERPEERQPTEPGWVGRVYTRGINVDPVRFQFKRNTGGKAGVGEEFKEVRKWDPEKAGIVSVWKDPKDGKTYVINGHHRVEMASRLGVEDLTVQYLHADDPSQARLKGALINVAEGRGDSIDAAKVFRDSGLSEVELEEQGISLKGRVASEGLALSKLSPSIFHDVLSGELPSARAAVIGSGLSSHEDQKAIYELVRKAEAKGKRLTNDQVAELIRQQKGSTPQREEHQQTLFGEEIFTRSLVLEKAEVSDYVRKQLAGERKLFSSVGQQRAADKLGQAGNVIDAAKNQAIAEEANRGLAVYDKLSLSAGEIADALNDAAEKLADGANNDTVKQEAFSRIRHFLVRQVEALTGKEASPRSGEAEDPGTGDGGGTEVLGSAGNRKARRGQRDPEVAGDQPKPSKRKKKGDKPDSSVYLGSGLGAIQAWFDRRPDAVLRLRPRAWLRSLKQSALRDAYELARPLGNRLKEAGSGAGAEIMLAIRRATDRGEVLAGKRLVRLVDAQLDRLSDEEAENLMDALQGREEPMNDRVRRAYRVAHNIHTELSEEAIDLGVETRGEDGDRSAFQASDNAFPRIVRPPDALKTGPVRRDVLRNLVHIGAAESAEEAAQMLDAYIELMESGKQSKTRAKAMIDYLITAGAANDEDQAWAMLQRHRRESMNPKRYAPIEFAAPTVPFWDPDPRRVLPTHVVAASIRIAHIAELGQDNEVIKKALRRIDETGGNVDEARKIVDRILAHINRADEKEAKLSRALRAIQGFKLGLAAVNNATQGTLNTMLYADLGAVATGLRAVFSSSGRRFAIEAGATLDPILQESVKDLAGSSSLLDSYLRATGFNATERANRVFAANAGAAYAQKLAKRGDRRSRQVLTELGLDADEVIARGSLTADEVLMAAKKFSDITQFRTRPEDLPGFASTPAGRVFFQFKNFAYAQTRFVGRNTIGELRSGNYGRFFRNLLVLGLAFPAAGELVRELRAFVSGRDRRDMEGIERWLDSMAAVGTLGMFYDVVEAGDRGKLLEFAAGPTAAELDKLGANLLNGDKGADEKLVRAWKDHVVPRLGPVRRLGEVD